MQKILFRPIGGFENTRLETKDKKKSKPKAKERLSENRLSRGQEQAERGSCAAIAAQLLYLQYRLRRNYC